VRKDYAFPQGEILLTGLRPRFSAA